GVHGGTRSACEVCASASCAVAAVNGTATSVAGGPAGDGVVPEQAAATSSNERARNGIGMPDPNAWRTRPLYRGRCQLCQPGVLKEHATLVGTLSTLSTMPPREAARPQRSGSELS